MKERLIFFQVDEFVRFAMRLRNHQNRHPPRNWSDMERHATIALYILLMIAVIIGADFLFFRYRFWERLIANIGIVLVFAAFYMRFLKSR